jgi:antitoxin component of RelBE/YafQ-DinJ toxin-antitoxin module
MRYTIKKLSYYEKYDGCSNIHVHVCVDDRLKADMTEKFANIGLSVSDAVRVFLTRVT